MQIKPEQNCSLRLFYYKIYFLDEVIILYVLIVRCLKFNIINSIFVKKIFVCFRQKCFMFLTVNYNALRK